MRKPPAKKTPPQARLILFNKPFRVLCQFTDREGRATLADYIAASGVYAAGRLDYDSEGLVVLTNEGRLQRLITDPRRKLPKTYLAQVEGIPDAEAVDKLRKGVDLNDGPTRPADVEVIDGEPAGVPARTPPIRYRKNIPAAWLKLTITEGRNRQVRRMTAAIGHPTLRLIRVAVGPWDLGGLKPGEWKDIPFQKDPAEHA